MTQNVQRWSQPCWTATNARAWPPKSWTTGAGAARAARMSPTAEGAPARHIAGSSFSAVPTTRLTPGRAAHAAGAIWAAHPVTTIARPGCSRAARRMACRACCSASWVTAQVLTTMASRSPAWPAITALS